jgi:N-methylhydantoinase B
MTTYAPSAVGQSSEFMNAHDVQAAYGIDLATAEAARAGLIEVTRHMYRTLQRSAFSNVARELLDFAVCIHLPSEEGSELVAVTEGCTHFAFTQASMTNFILDEWGIENLGPGDTIACNDPWRGSIHMPDINLFRPVFWKGELVFMLSDATHLTDIGGPSPGGFNNSAENVFSEGVRLPPTLITSGGVPVRSTINLLLENSRTPQHVLGDLRALFGTMKVGEERIVRLLERYGKEQVVAAARYATDLAHRRVRQAIRAVPDGVYSAEEWIDDDGVGTDPLRLFVTAKVAGANVEIDFTGTDRQPLGALTTCWEETCRFLIGAKMILDPNHPLNSGMMRPFDFVAPPGTVVMGLPPTSSSQHAELAAPIASLSLKLFSQMLPERAVASDGGTSCSATYGGIDQRPGREGQPWGLVIILGLGWGGTATTDGVSFCTTPIFGVSCPTFELMERDGPIVLRSLNAMIDSAGAGKFRAGFQNSLMLEVTGPAAWTSIFDSGRFTRDGANGGADGMTSYGFEARKDADGRVPSVNGIVPLDHLVPLMGKFDEAGAPDPRNGEWGRGTKYLTGKLSNIPLAAGDVLYSLPASGAGFGDPLERDPDLVRTDVWNELVSLSAAASQYGVVVDPGDLTVDAAATTALRAELHASRAASGEAVPVSIVHPWPRTVADLPASASTK